MPLLCAAIAVYAHVVFPPPMSAIRDFRKYKFFFPTYYNTVYDTIFVHD